MVLSKGDNLPAHFQTRAAAFSFNNMWKGENNARRENVCLVFDVEALPSWSENCSDFISLDVGRRLWLE